MVNITPRTVRVRNLRTSVEEVQAYLPANYSVAGDVDGRILITGQDQAGWTMDDYVIPRLASGLIWIEEVMA